MTKPTLLVMAAGIGSRYGGIKQIDPVGPAGETIIDYSIYDALKAGFGRLVFVIRRDIERQFKEIVGARFEKRLPVKYVFQDIGALPPGFAVPAGRTKPWGTTHAILAAQDAIKEPFAVINADDFYGREAFELLAKQLASGVSDYAMVGFILNNTLSEFGSVSRGVSWTDANHYLSTINEMKKIVRDASGIRNTDAQGNVTPLSGSETVSMNFWGFTSGIFPRLQADFIEFLKKSGGEMTSECYIPLTVGSLIKANQAKVKVLQTRGSWFGVTYKEDRPHVVESIRQLIARGEYPERLWE
jgi:hypothetical protein